MKFLVALSAVVALATVNCQLLPNYGNGPLYDDIKYFVDMIPMNEVTNVVMQYTLKDAEFQELLKEMRSSQFKEMVQEIEAIPEFHQFATYMQNNGVYMYDMLNDLNKAVGLPSFQPLLISTKITGGLKGLFLDVKALVNYDDIIHGYVYKMRTSQAFRDFVAHLKSTNHQNFVNKLYQNQNYLSFRNTLVSKGLDITLVEDVIYTALGIEFPVLKQAMFENRLSKDIHDFIDLVDMDKVIHIVSSYLEDDEVKEALGYLRSEKFHVLVRKVEALKAYQNLVEYLHNAGLDIYGLIQKIHMLFGMEDYVPPSGKYVHFYSNHGGMKALVDAVRAALPMDKFKALFQQKMQTSPDFKAFVETLQSAEFETIVNTIYQEPIFLEMRQKAKDVGLDLDRGRHFFEEIGIKLPHPSGFFYLAPFENKLSKDIHDFIDLVEMDKVIHIVSSYLEDDEVKQFVTYMKSEEFHVLVRKVEALKAYQNLVQYLHNAGLNIYGLIQKIHMLFGMEDYVPPSGGYVHLYSNLGGMKAMVDAVRAALPMDKFKALFQQKMQTSPDFKAFVEKLQSAEFGTIVNTIYQEPIFLELRQKAKAVGLDLDRGRHFFEEIGIKLPHPSGFFYLAPFENKLSKDIHDFIDLVEMDKVIHIVSSYLEDDEVKQFVTYMKSEEFHVLVRKVEALKAYQNLVQYLHNAGLNIYGLIQKIHMLFGMEDYVPPSGGYVHLYSNLGGMKAMVDAVRAALPMDKFKALFQQKMQTSPDFKAFVEKLQSAEFGTIVNTIYQEPIFLELRQKAKAVGLDLDRGRHFFEEIGIKLPHPSGFFYLTPFENKLSKDIHDFIDLVEMDKVIHIVSSYLEDDEVKQFVTYMKSEEFHVLVRKVEALKAYQNLVQYLHNAGLNIYGLIQKIHMLFGMEDYVPPSGGYVHLYSNLGGMKAMVDAVRAALPMDKFKALFQQKMQTSPDFKAFVEKLQSAEFGTIVNTIYQEPIFLELRQKAKAVGLDLDRGRHFFEEIGIKLPRPSGFFYLAPFENKLSKDIHDFIDLVEMDKVIHIVSSYLEDDEVKQFVTYMKSEEFHVLVRKVEALKAYQNLVQYLHNAGLNIYGLIQKIHMLFGMEDYVPPSGGYVHLYSNLGGMKAMVDAVRAALPMDKFKALFQQKMQTSPDFKAFVEKLQSAEFGTIVNTIYQEPIFLELRQKAKAVGLDLDRGRHFFEEIGIKLPHPSGFFY